MRFREVEKIILQDGWYEVDQVGSHHQYKHPTKLGKVTIPEHICAIKEENYEVSLSGNIYTV